jgi:hypothetical protein
MLLQPGYTSLTGRHDKLPATRAGNAISFMSRGHEAFPYLQYTATHADPDHYFFNYVQSAIILQGGHGRLKQNVDPGC